MVLLENDIKHDKVGELNPCDDNKMIALITDTCSAYTLQYSVLLISTCYELTMGAMDSYLNSLSLMQLLTVV